MVFFQISCENRLILRIQGKIQLNIFVQHLHYLHFIFSRPKWIVLDGDIDPMWIESLNTVMDDNKVLTLASNERIALTKEMRLLFEISNLKTATPATGKGFII